MEKEKATVVCDRCGRKDHLNQGVQVVQTSDGSPLMELCIVCLGDLADWVDPT